jgi:hypothetical protein
MPARKRSESPGKKRPIKRPVSMKMIAKMPTKPRVEMIEWASKRFTERFIAVRLADLRGTP